MEQNASKAPYDWNFDKEKFLRQTSNIIGIPTSEVKERIEHFRKGLSISILWKKLETVENCELQSLAKICRDSSENLLISGSLLRKISNALMKYSPDTFEQFATLLNLVCCTSLLKCSEAILPSRGLLEKTFLQADSSGWETSFVHIHIISKQLFELMEDPTNISSFVLDICTLNRFGFYLSITLVWSLIKAALNMEIQMHRIHEFRTLINFLRNFDLNSASQHVTKLYTLLECLSFILGATCGQNVHRESSIAFKKFFEYDNDDVNGIMEWCEMILEKFPVRITHNVALVNASMAINEIILFNIFRYKVPENDDFFNISDSLDFGNF